MITKEDYHYVSYLKASRRYQTPATLRKTINTCTKIHFDCEVKFAKALRFINRKAMKFKDHPIRPVFGSLGNFHKVSVDIRNKKIYLVKQTYKKDHNILVL
ncbi:hypothetical protein NVP1121O_078 [Vibrio phage 1.121.O._10N.286.46.C4]|nr:hypothetical protein NVP1121O_078 [Vibrio phage 1.121.O._10N.286.46.C4]